MLSQGVSSLLEEAGPFVGRSFIQDFQKGVWHYIEAKILVVGAGGLGCEIIKSLVFNGFKNIDIVDMSKIKISDLNRQFFFKKKDVGRFKAEVAAEYVINHIRNRYATLKINHHACQVQELPDGFFDEFDLIIGGIDNLTAKKFICQKLIETARLKSKIIPYIDGDISFWNGRINVIYPNHTACIGCYDIKEQSKYIPDTFVYKRKTPESLIDYILGVTWQQNHGDETFDRDNLVHLKYVVYQANLLSQKFNIDFQFDLKFVNKYLNKEKGISASTCTIIGSMCCTEALKIISGRSSFLNNKPDVNIDENPTNLMNYYGNSDSCGISMQSHNFPKKNDCSICKEMEILKFIENETVEQLLKRLETEKNIVNVEVLMNNNRIIINNRRGTSEEKLSMKLSEFDVKLNSVLYIITKNDDQFDFILQK